MGVLDHIRAVQFPNHKQILTSYKEAKNTIKQIDINTVNVRFWPKNSPYFVNTKGTLFHYTNVTLLKIELPEKLGWIVQDDSIAFDKATKEEWVECRQDYPLTLSVNNLIANAIKEAIKEHRDVKEWYIPASINKLPVKNIIVHHSKANDEIVKTELIKSGAPQSILQIINSLPTDVEVTTKFLYDYADVRIMESMKEETTKGGLILVFMGVLMGALMSGAFFVYIGR